MDFTTVFCSNKSASFLPRIKAKSCNYAISFARGKYVVIYDADDKLDPLQLKKH
ncbi:MAG: glycosyltransferase [Wolbachia sp.]